MPIISGGGGGSAGLPSQWTVGPGGGLRIALSADETALAVRGATGGTAALLDLADHADNHGLFMDKDGNVAVYAAPGSANLPVLDVQADGAGYGLNAHDAVGRGGGQLTVAITSGALPTVAPVSGTAFQCLSTRDVVLVVPFTGDATNNAATLKIELSPDNVTFSILDTLSIAAALNLTGAINVPVTVAVPAAWYVKLTATHGAIATATYY